MANGELPPDGRHLAFPFRIASDGRTAQVESLPGHVHDELIQLILTSPGERPFLPEFGGGARRLVFDAAGDVSAAMAKAMVSQALAHWLGNRLIVEELKVEAVESKLEIELAYRLVGTEDSRRVKFERSGG